LAKKKSTAPAKTQGRLAKRFGGLARYFREVRAEVKKVVWPTRRAAVNLTMIVLAVTVSMSAALGFIDWIFSRMFAFIIMIAS
jgi:preprotein translocase subunit SecE